MAHDPDSVSLVGDDGPPPPLSAGALALLEAERAAPPPDAAIAARVSARVHSSVGVAKASVVAKVTWLAAAVTAGAIATTLAWPEPSTPGGAPQGRSTTGDFAANGPHAAPLSPPAIAPAPSVPVPVAPVLARAAAESETPTRRRDLSQEAVTVAVVEPPPIPSEVRPLPERVLVLAARDALVKARDPKAALVRLAEAAKAYPRGALREERDRLRFQALFASGRIADAQRAAREFLKRYPTSVHRAAAEALLAE